MTVLRGWLLRVERFSDLVTQANPVGTVVIGVDLYSSQHRKREGGPLGEDGWALLDAWGVFPASLFWLDVHGLVHVAAYSRTLCRGAGVGGQV